MIKETASGESPPHSTALVRLHLNINQLVLHCLAAWLSGTWCWTWVLLLRLLATLTTPQMVWQPVLMISEHYNTWYQGLEQPTLIRLSLHVSKLFYFLSQVSQFIYLTLNTIPWCNVTHYRPRVIP